MPSIAITVQEARDLILKRVGSYGSSEHEAVVLEFLNYALIDLVQEHDWEVLQRRTTLTYSANTNSLLDLPYSCDRVVTIRPATNYYLPLEKVSPVSMESIKARYTFTIPKVYCSYEFTQLTDVNVPYQKIQIYDTPGNGDEFYLWYIQHYDEFTSADLATVPNLPTSIWKMVIKTALVQFLEFTEASSTVIQIENALLEKTKNAVKSREKHTTSVAKEIVSTDKHLDWKAYRKDPL